jgi:hypothetical protein
MTKFAIIYGEPLSSCCIEDTTLREFGRVTVGSFVFTEEDIKEALLDWLKQRAISRRRKRFIDPGTA